MKANKLAFLLSAFFYSTGEDGNIYELKPTSETSFYYAEQQWIEYEFRKAGNSDYITLKIHNASRVIEGQMIKKR